MCRLLYKVRKVSQTRSGKIPIENERKYVLSLNCEDEIRDNSVKKIEITQGYLVRKEGLTVRIRKSFDDKETYCLTVKQRVDGKIVEIETDIKKKDYALLVTKASGWVNKTRYYLDADWVVDFFRDEGLYFVLAEIELPEDIEEPGYMPEEIFNNLKLIVPKDDYRFSSKKLSDKVYARGLLEGI